MRAGRQGERWDRDELFATDPQRLAAGDEDGELRALADELGDVVGGRHDLLEVVQDEEHPLRPQVLRHGSAEVAVAGSGEARPAGDLDEDGGGVARVREIDEGGAVGVVLERVGGRLDGEPRLADAAGPRQGAQAYRLALEDLPELLELRCPADQCRRGYRQVARDRVERLRRWEGRREAPCHDLVEPFGRRQVLEAMLAEVLERRVPGQCVADQRPRRLRQEDLATVAGRHDARGPVDVHADIHVARQFRFARVDADLDLDVGAVGPRLGGNRALDANRGLDRVAGGPEHGEE